MSTNPIQTSHGWSKDALLTKVQRYAEQMYSYPQDDWRFAFWSTLVLELLARAALAHVNPVLLADSKDWNNLYHALGFQPKESKFVPRSIDISTVLIRLGKINPSFTNELVQFGKLHMSRRNEELHSGDNPFDVFRNSSWLPTYYQTCKVLLQSMDHDLEIIICSDNANDAETMISAAQDQTAKSVKKLVAAHETIWENKNPKEKQELSSQATTWATRYEGHRVKCPSCKSDALISGEPIAAPLKDIKNDQITETQQYRPSKFECVACGLKISGLSHLIACGLGDTYKATFTYDAAEYYQLSDEYADFEPDYNEP